MNHFTFEGIQEAANAQSSVPITSQPDKASHFNLGSVPVVDYIGVGALTIIIGLMGNRYIRRPGPRANEAFNNKTTFDYLGEGSPNDDMPLDLPSDESKAR